jgi:hypothetical protein
VTPATFATQNLRPRDQLPAWQEWFAPVFDISPMEQAKDGFSAKNIVWSLGDISISRVLAPSVHVKRAKANLAKAPIDHWVLTYCRQGATNVQTPKGEFDATEGVPFLWSFGEQFESKRTRVDRTEILLSREAFHDLAPLLDAARGAALEKPWGGLLGDNILAVERWLPFMKESDAPRLTAAVRNMVAACIAPSAKHRILARAEIDCGLLERVRRIIQAQLQSPQLAACRAVPNARDFPIPALPPVRTNGRRCSLHPASTISAHLCVVVQSSERASNRCHRGRFLL